MLKNVEKKPLCVLCVPCREGCTHVIEYLCEQFTVMITMYLLQTANGSPILCALPFWGRHFPNLAS